MSRIVERIPLLMSAGTLLAGAMLFAASANYTSRQLTGVVFAAEEGCQFGCDAEDSDDCPSGCKCNDPSRTCISAAVE